jgi:hypothetical protein
MCKNRLKSNKAFAAERKKPRPLKSNVRHQLRHNSCTMIKSAYLILKIAPYETASI